MHDNLAIIILGVPNAGNTTTLKHFCNTYYSKPASIFRIGWRISLTPFSPKYGGVKLNGYFVPGSPTEKGICLKDVIGALVPMPEFLFIAEQSGGSQYNNTISFLRIKNYHIKEFIIDDSSQDSIWHKYSKRDEQVIQNYRTEQIADYVRKFILSRI